MEYITSRGFTLPTDKNEMESADWYNMWSKQYFPYKEMLIGDILYWFDTTKQKLVWKSQITEVERSPYSDKKIVFARFSNSLGSKYQESRPDSGYFVSYKVRVIEKLNIEKPAGFKFPQLGWLRIDNSISLNWFGVNIQEESNILDDNIIDANLPISSILKALNIKMQNVAPERIQALVRSTIRNDTAIVKILKEAANHKCQFPGCKALIVKEKGGHYVEVAHIKAVAKGGKSVLGNLIVLCPNHHKEFDVGARKITYQSPVKIKGLLNNKEFEIDLINL
jgi:hypothetical protein